MLILPVVFAVSLVAVAETASLSPMDQIKKDVGAIVALLQDKSLEHDARWAKISEILYARIDSRAMSQSVLAANWRTATDEEKEKFVEYFSQYLEQIYRQKIEAYSNQRVDYLHETIAGEDRAVVDTVIVTDQTQIPVTYKMRKTGDEWFITDVVIEGLSLVNNYRATFADKIKQDGMDGLLADIKSQIEEYRAEYLKQRQAELAGQAAPEMEAPAEE
jgi:phospholipid transport system substrate-binding protein